MKTHRIVVLAGCLVLLGSAAGPAPPPAQDALSLHTCKRLADMPLAD